MSHYGPLSGSEHSTPLSQPYWDALARGELVLQKCAACGRFQHYPRLLCKHCGAVEFGWSGVAGEGTVVGSVRTSRTSKESLKEQLPYPVALLRLDDGPMLMATADDDPVVGSRAEIDFEATSKSGRLTIRPSRDGDG